MLSVLKGEKIKMDNMQVTILHNCRECAHYNDCVTYSNTSCAEGIECEKYEPLAIHMTYAKTMGLQMHECPVCRHKFWD